MVGKTLSHYSILAELGRGGMGIVYKAEDTKLDRTVAIKVLPSAALSSEDDRARFYREAKAAAQLHHPNIASVFEIDEAVPEGSNSDDLRPFIAMEFIDGETLDARIKKGPLKLSEAVRIAGEIAEALKAAHAKDIVHRDIKSANVMLDAEGRAKVLDFGLAKTAQSTKLTRMGSTLGTMAYMSPEQARGEEVDRRTDIWALGAVLYEMVSGRLPFAGDYEQAVVYSILNEQPEPLTAVRTGVPMGLEWIVTKALAKKAEDRYQSVSDLIVDLKNVDTASLALSRSISALSSAAISAAPVASKKNWTTSLPTAAGMIAGLLAVVAIAWFVGTRMAVTEPPAFKKLTLHIDGISELTFPVMSPTGDFIVFQGVDTLRKSGIFLHDLTSSETRFIQGTETHGYPLLSPNGDRLLSSSRGIFVTEVRGGLPVQWADRGRGEAWEGDETIILEYDGDTFRLSQPGGSFELVARPDSVPGAEVFIFSGDILQREKVLLASYQFASNQNANLVLVDLRSGVLSPLESAAINAWSVADGFVQYQLGTDEGPMVIRRFDRKTLDWAGPPESLLPETEWTRVRPTHQGDLLYVPPSRDKVVARMEWLMEDGSRSVIQSLTSENWFYLSLSPDGETALLSKSTSDVLWNVSVMSVDVASGDASVLANVPGQATWSADGRDIFRSTSMWEFSDIVRQRVGALTSSDTTAHNARYPHASSDGEWLVYSRENDEGDSDIGARNLVTGDSLVVVSSPDDEIHPRISPDNRWVAYIAALDEGTELRVAALDRLEESQVLARDVGTRTVWSVDGRYLYFGRDGNVFRIRVETDGRFRTIGTAEQLTSDGLVRDIAHDPSSSRMLLLTDDRPPPDYVVLEWWQNWAAELDRTLPRY